MLFFLGTSPVMILISRSIQGASTTFTWVTGLAFLVAQVGEGDLGAYVGWTTVGVAVGEIIGPLVGGPVYDYFGHWAAFGVVEALLLVDILLRVLAKEKKPGLDNYSYEMTNGEAKEEESYRLVIRSLAWNWLGTVFVLVIIFMVRGALEVVSWSTYISRNPLSY